MLSDSGTSILRMKTIVHPQKLSPWINRDMSIANTHELGQHCMRFGSTSMAEKQHQACAFESTPLSKLDKGYFGAC